MIKNLFGKVLNFTKEHNQEILVGLGVAGMMTSTVLAVKATPTRVSYRDYYEERRDPIRTERRTSFRQSYDDIEFDTREDAEEVSDKMDEIALWLLDLFKMQYNSLKDSMYSKKIRRDTFDKLSYSAWAVSESIRAINDWNGWVDEHTIAEILQVQLDHYIRFGSSDKECHKKYIYAADMIEQIMELIGGNIYD